MSESTPTQENVQVGRSWPDAATELAKLLGRLTPAVVIAAAAAYAIYMFRAQSDNSEARLKEQSQVFQEKLSAERQEVFKQNEESRNLSARLLRETYSQMDQLNANQLTNLKTLLTLQEELQQQREKALTDSKRDMEDAQRKLASAQSRLDEVEKKQIEAQERLRKALADGEVSLQRVTADLEAAQKGQIAATAERDKIAVDTETLKKKYEELTSALEEEKKYGQINRALDAALREPIVGYPGRSPYEDYLVTLLRAASPDQEKIVAAVKNRSLVATTSDALWLLCVLRRATNDESGLVVFFSAKKEQQWDTGVWTVIAKNSYYIPDELWKPIVGKFAAAMVATSPNPELLDLASSILSPSRRSSGSTMTARQAISQDELYLANVENLRSALFSKTTSSSEKSAALRAIAQMSTTAYRAYWVAVLESRPDPDSKYLELSSTHRQIISLSKLLGSSESRSAADLGTVLDESDDLRAWGKWSEENKRCVDFWRRDKLSDASLISLDLCEPAPKTLSSK